MLYILVALSFTPTRSIPPHYNFMSSFSKNNPLCPISALHVFMSAGFSNGTWSIYKGVMLFFKKKYFLLILWDFHIVCSNSTHFPEPPYLPLNLVVSPYKENLKRNKSKILIKNTKQIQQKTKQPNKKHTKKS